MHTHKLKFQFGDWATILKNAMALTSHYQYVEFKFNGSNVIVDKNTNAEHLWRDHLNASYAGWKTIGPDCVDEYDKETADKIEKVKAEKEEEWRLRQDAYRKKEAQEMKEFSETVKGIEINLSSPDKWQTFKECNKDGYGNACIEYAEGWAKLMQVEISQGKTVAQCAEKTSHQLGFMGITGFMYGAAVSMLSQCWIHGEDLRKWHNKEYNHEGNGVVNPAVLTVS